MGVLSKWIDKAREVAKEYRSNCEELRRLREAEGGMSSLPQGVPVMNGKISRPVEAEVERRLLQERRRYLEQATEAVDFAIAQVVEKPQGMLTFQIFQMVYYYHTHRLYGAALALNISERTAIRYNTYFLKMIAVHMGFLKSGTF